MTNDLLNRMRADIEMLKVQGARLQPLGNDVGELSDWAKSELADALATPQSEGVSPDEVREEIRARLRVESESPLVATSMHQSKTI